MITPKLPDDIIKALLERCVRECMMTGPVTLDFTDAEGRVASARYYEDRDPEQVEGKASGVEMQPPLQVFAYDAQGTHARFTIPVFEVGTPPIMH